MGLVFTVIEPDQRRVLEKWLGELHAGSPADNQVTREGKECTDKHNASGTQKQVLNELIVTLMRNGVLSNAQGKALQKLLHP